MKDRTMASAYFINSKRSMMFSMAKNNARKPNTAKTLLVKTMNGSVEMASAAGMLSTAKIRSLTSMTIRARNRGVNTKRTFSECWARSVSSIFARGMKKSWP